MTQFRIAGCNVQYTRRRFADFVEAQRGLGIKTIEFVAQVPHIWCDHMGWEDETPVKTALERAEIGVAAFTPKLYRYSTCAAPGSSQRTHSAEYFANAIKLAKRLSAPVLCIDVGGGCFDAPAEILWESCRKTLVELCALAEDVGINLAMSSASPSDSPILTTLQEIGKMKKEVGHKNLKAVLDTRAAGVMGEKIGEWFDAFGEDIALVRFSDGNYSGYRVWGEGCLPCGGFLREIKECGYGGVLSMYRGGERDVADPVGADEKNYSYLSEALEKICLR